ncbi:hypothetical protein NN561_010603 [Cricetulus griseus]
MGTIARGRGTGLEKYSLCGGACHSRPGPRAAGWALSSQLQCFGRGAPGPGPGPLGILKVPKQPLARCHSPALSGPGAQRSVSSSQPMSNPESAQQRLEQGPKPDLPFAHLWAHAVVLGAHCPTDPCGFQKPVPLAQTPATASTPCGVRPARDTHNIPEWLKTPLFRTTNSILRGQVPVGPHSEFARARGQHTHCMLPRAVTCSTAYRVRLGGHILALATNTHHACAQGLAHVHFVEAHLLAHSHSCLLRVHSLAYPRVPPNTPGRAGAHTRRPASPPRTLSACPSARGSAVPGPTGDRRCCAGFRGPSSHAAYTAPSLLSPDRGRPRAPPTAPQSVSSCIPPALSRTSGSQARPSQHPDLMVLVVAQTQVILKPKGPPGGSSLPFFSGSLAFQSSATRPPPTPELKPLSLRFPTPGSRRPMRPSRAAGRWLHLPAGPVHRLCAA